MEREVNALHTDGTNDGRARCNSVVYMRTTVAVGSSDNWERLGGIGRENSLRSRSLDIVTAFLHTEGNYARIHL